MRKFNKNIVQALLLVLILQLVTPLLAFAKSGNSLKILVKDEDTIIDYWKISDKKIDDPMEVVEKYQNMEDEELDEIFGQKHSQEIGEPSYSYYKIEIENLEKGSYLLRQRENSSKKFIPFIAYVDNTSQTIIPKSHPDGIVLRKLEDSEEKKPLEGVEFEAIDEDGKVLEFIKDGDSYILVDEGGKSKLITDKAGKIKLLGIGEKRVKFKETRALQGYILDEKSQTDFLEDGSYAEMLNKKIEETNRFSFIKIDGTSENPLKGAVFKVQKKTDMGFEDIVEDGRIYTLTSDDRGEFKTKDLAYGDYRLIETRAPNNYITNSKPIEFKIGEKSHTRKIYVKNYKADTPRPEGSQTSGGRLQKKASSIVKTGDIKILLILILGLILIAYGVKTVRAKK